VANITIKDLPARLHKELKSAARSQGRSLNGYIISVLEMSVEERSRRKVMRQGRSEFRTFLASLPRFANSTDMIRDDRDRGHQ